MAGLGSGLNHTKSSNGDLDPHHCFFNPGFLPTYTIEDPDLLERGVQGALLFIPDLGVIIIPASLDTCEVFARV